MGLSEEEAIELQSGSATFADSQVNPSQWPKMPQGVVVVDPIVSLPSRDDEIPPGMTLDACEEIMRGTSIEDDDAMSNETRALVFCGSDAKYMRVVEVAKMLDAAENRGRRKVEEKAKEDVRLANQRTDKVREQARVTRVDIMRKVSSEALSAAEARYGQVIESREKYLDAFIAETGLRPSECELIEIDSQDGHRCVLRTTVRRRPGTPSARQGNPSDTKETRA